MNTNPLSSNNQNSPRSDNYVSHTLQDSTPFERRHLSIMRDGANLVKLLFSYDYENIGNGILRYLSSREARTLGEVCKDMHSLLTQKGFFDLRKAPINSRGILLEAQETSSENNATDNLSTQKTKAAIWTWEQTGKKQSNERYFRELRRQRKKEDIEALYEMWKAISRYKKGELTLESTINRISYLSGGEDGISVSYKYDNELYTIRNKYGYKQRTLGNKENLHKEGRVDFENLYRINAILKSGVELPEKVPQDIDILGAKLLYILSEELKLESLLDTDKTEEILQLGEQKGNIADLEKISTFVRAHYRDVVLDKIKFEVSQFTDFTLYDKDSIYFFARKMVIIGESCHDLEEYAKGNEELKKLKKLFGALYYMRNGFVHFHNKILFNLNTDNKIDRANQSFQKFIGVFRELLNEDIFTNCAKNSEKLNQCVEAINDLILNLRRRSKYELQYRLESELIKVKQVLDVLESEAYKKLFFSCKNFSQGLSETAVQVDLENLDKIEKDGNISYLFAVAKSLSSKLGPANKNQLEDHVKALEEYIKNQNIKELDEQYKLMIKDDEFKEFLREICGETFCALNFSELEKIKEISKALEVFKEPGTISKNVKSLRNRLGTIRDLKGQYEKAVTREESSKKIVENLKKEIDEWYKKAKDLVSYSRRLYNLSLKLPQISEQLQELAQLVASGMDRNNWKSLLSAKSTKLDQLLSLESLSILQWLDEISEELDAVLDYLPSINIIDKCIELSQRAINCLTKQNVSLQKLSDVSKEFNKLKEEVNKLEPEDKDSLLKRFNFKISQEQAEKEKINKLFETIVLKSERSNKRTSLLKKINKEMQYLSKVEKGNASKAIKDAIIEHIVTVIGQYVRELEELQPLALDQVLSSRLLKEAGMTCKMARSKGLAHEVLYFYQDRFLKNLYDDILPAQQDFQAAYAISEGSLTSIPKTAVVFNRLGQALTRLCLFKEAIQYFEAALTDLRNSLQLEDRIYPQTKVDQFKLYSIKLKMPVLRFENCH